MKKTVAILIFFVFILNANAQQRKIDSLKKIISSTAADTSKILATCRLGGAYYYSKPDTAMSLALQSMQQSKKINFLKGEALSLNLQGIIFTNTGNYPKAMQALVAALKLNEKRNDVAEIGRNLSNMGVVANFEGDIRQSINYYRKGLVPAEAVHNPISILTVNIDLGDDYEKLDILDSARFYTQRAFEQALKLKDTDNIAGANNNLGNIYAKMKNPAIALSYFRTALPLWKPANDDDGVCETAIGMAKLFKLSGQKDSSLYYARLSMTTGTRAGFTARVLTASKFLSDYFAEQGKIDSAFHYQKLSIAANETLFSQEKTREVQNANFEEKQRQAEIAEQRLLDEEHSKKNLQLAGISVFIPTFFLFILFLSRRKTKPRTVEFLGILALLMVFEFITLLVHPYIEKLTNDTPAISLMILVCIAALLVPFHHRAEHWVKSKLLPAGHHGQKAE